MIEENKISSPVSNSFYYYINCFQSIVPTADVCCFPYIAKMAFHAKTVYLYTYKTLITLKLYVCLFEAVRTNRGYGMATLIYNNLLNYLISGTVILLRSS